MPATMLWSRYCWMFKFGDGTSTQINLNCRFQSPLHRGHAFNHASAQVPRETPGDFSPLFIGDTRSTTQVERLVLCMKKYFSPLFIGDTRSTLYQLDALKR